MRSCPTTPRRLADEDGDFVDWLELHNYGAEAVTLKGFGLSDNPNRLLKWTFTSESIPPGGFLIVFLSGKAREAAGENSPHTSFRLANGSESLFFSNPAGTLLNEAHPPGLRKDRSFARHHQSPFDWHIFDGSPAPTPGEANDPKNSSLPDPYVRPPSFSHPGGFVASPLTINLTPTQPGDTVYYTLDGSEPDPESSEIAASEIVLEEYHCGFAQFPSPKKGMRASPCRKLGS